MYYEILLKFDQHPPVNLSRTNFSRHQVFSLLEFRIMTNLN